MIKEYSYSNNCKRSLGDVICSIGNIAMNIVVTMYSETNGYGTYGGDEFVGIEILNHYVVYLKLVKYHMSMTTFS